METPFGITREELLNLAAQKLADEYGTDGDIHGHAKRIIESKVKEAFDTNLNQQVILKLTSEMERLMSEEICPVDIYGSPTGKPTTMRAVLAERGRIFWDEKVDGEGRISSYGGIPRHQHLFQKIVNEEFTKAVRQNIVNLVGAFKDAISAKAAEITKEHINSLIKVKTPND